MNEFLFILVTLLALSLTLVALRLGKHWVLGFIVTLLIIANIFASKLSLVFGMPSSLAIPLYGAIFLATDLLAEHYGKRVAYRAVWMGFGAQACLVLFGQLLSMATSLGESPVSEALSVVFGNVPRVVLGSFVAYLISQTFDVAFFHALKKKTEGKHLWLRNLGSTTVSQGLDTAIFITIAFYGVLPNLLEFMLSVWIIKICVCIVDTPFIYLSYLVVRKAGKINA